MEIKFDGKRFFIGDESKPHAVLNALRSGDCLICDHTYVSEEMRGKKLASLLFDEMINYARKENLKVRPLCSFVDKKMNESEEFKDMRA